MREKMKAVICTGYGTPNVLVIQNIPKPILKSNDLLIQILAFPITTPERRIRSLDVPILKAQAVLKLFLRAKFGFFKPRNSILGNYLAGKIVAIGKNVTRFHVGEEIFARSNKQSTYAEYICLAEDSAIVLKPSNLTFEETAALPYGGGNALYFLTKIGGIKKGDKILVYGASGAIGTAAVQLAKHFGAIVTGVCSATNLELIKSLGANHVIDYTGQDYTKCGEIFDIVFDTVGKTTAGEANKVLQKNCGKYVSVFSSGKAQIQSSDLLLLKELATAEEIKPVIDKCYPFEDISDAHKYADQGHIKGNIVVTIHQGVGNSCR
jgi:NADPH:quinone reductase-like Zn-dependent oxidoreductase